MGPIPKNPTNKHTLPKKTKNHLQTNLFPPNFGGDTKKTFTFSHNNNNNNNLQAQAILRVREVLCIHVLTSRKQLVPKHQGLEPPVGRWVCGTRWFTWPWGCPGLGGKKVAMTYLQQQQPADKRGRTPYSDKIFSCMLVESSLSLAMLPLLLLPLLSLLLRYVKDEFFIFTLYKLGKIALLRRSWFLPTKIQICLWSRVPFRPAHIM